MGDGEGQEGVWVSLADMLDMTLHVVPQNTFPASKRYVHAKVEPCATDSCTNNSETLVTQPRRL